MISWLAEGLSALILALFLRIFVVSLARIRGRSMLPTLQDGDFVLVWRLPYRFRHPRRQEVVICHYPGRMHPRLRFLPQCIVKRVIALPGDTLETDAGRVHVNYEMMEENYLDPRRCRFQGDRPLQASDGFFVMGDNRDSSNDSRRVGPLSRQAVLGRVVCVIWPPKRWGRVR